MPKPDLGTLAVDMYWRLYYDPLILPQWPVEVIQGVLYHEVCHLLRDHAARMKDYDPHLSNMATDAEINDDLIREGIRFPHEPLTPQSLGQPENLLAEEYYTALVSKQEQKSEKQRQSQTHTRPDSAEENNSASRSGQGDYSNDPSERQSSGLDESVRTENDQSERPLSGSGWCGSCATGQMAPWEEPPPSKGLLIGLSKMEGELIRRHVANEIQEHAKAQGRIPGHWLRWAKEKLQPQVDWRKQLAATVRAFVADTAGATDYSYRRPSRRQGQAVKGNVIFPSLRFPVPSVAVIADTSGSIADRMLAQILAEITGILKVIGQREGVRVLAVDQTVQFCRQIFRPEQVQLIGGGGTDMGVGLEAAARLKPSPQLGIVITDGYTSWPARPPRGMKVIVVLIGEGKAPSWAKTINISSA